MEGGLKMSYKVIAWECDLSSVSVLSGGPLGGNQIMGPLLSWMDSGIHHGSGLAITGEISWEHDLFSYLQGPSDTHVLLLWTMEWCSKEVSKTTNQIISGHYKLLICGIILWRHKIDSDSSRGEVEILHFQQVPRWHEHWQEAMIRGQIPSRSKDLGPNTFFFSLIQLNSGTGSFLDLGHLKARSQSRTFQLCIDNETFSLRSFILKLLAFLLHLCPVPA